MTKEFEEEKMMRPMDSISGHEIICEELRRDIQKLLPSIDQYDDTEWVEYASWDEIYDYFKASSKAEVRACVAAADWWLRQIMKNNKDYHLTEEQVALFKTDFLYHLLSSLLKRHYIIVHSDRESADLRLVEAILMIRKKDTIFPENTFMNVSKDSVEVITDKGFEIVYRTEYTETKTL